MTTVVSYVIPSIFGQNEDPASATLQTLNTVAQINSTLGAKTVTTISNNGNVTLNATTLLSGILVRQGNANNAMLNVTDTTDTAANICAQIQAAAPGISLSTTAMIVKVINQNTSNTITLAGGSGVTITGGAGNANIANSNWKDYLVTFGSNANVVTFTSLGGGSGV